MTLVARLPPGSHVEQWSSGAIGLIKKWKGGVPGWQVPVVDLRFDSCHTILC